MIRKILILCGLILALSTSAMAQSGQTSEVRKQVLSLVSKYEQKSGFDAMTTVKGKGLELIKVMMRKEFGKEFIKGVNIIVIIDYSAVSQSDAQMLRSDLQKIKKYCEQAEIPAEVLKEEKGVTDLMFRFDSNKEYMTDFILLHEEAKERMMVYFGGKIKADPYLF